MGDSAQCTVVLSGEVGEAVVEQVVGTLAALPSGGALVIDASQASRLEAAVLGLLVRAIRQHGRRATIRLRGLSRQDVRLLAYLGLEVDGSVVALADRRPRPRLALIPQDEPAQWGALDRD
jgi:anti-anti-sigma regulatory factor